MINKFMVAGIMYEVHFDFMKGKEISVSFNPKDYDPYDESSIPRIGSSFVKLLRIVGKFCLMLKRKFPEHKIVFVAGSERLESCYVRMAKHCGVTLTPDGCWWSIN